MAATVFENNTVHEANETSECMLQNYDIMYAKQTEAAKTFPILQELKSSKMGNENKIYGNKLILNRISQRFSQKLGSAG